MYGTFLRQHAEPLASEQFTMAQGSRPLCRLASKATHAKWTTPRTCASSAVIIHTRPRMAATVTANASGTPISSFASLFALCFRINRCARLYRCANGGLTLLAFPHAKTAARTDTSRIQRATTMPRANANGTRIQGVAAMFVVCGPRKKIAPSTHRAGGNHKTTLATSDATSSTKVPLRVTKIRTASMTSPIRFAAKTAA